MTECEVCGKNGAGRKAKIEGVIMDVCDRCVSMGQEMAAPKITVQQRAVQMPEEMSVSIRGDLGQFVRKRREKMNLTQEELARRLLLNVSLITRIENGWQPPLPIIEKLEKFFKTKLKETAEETKTKTQTRNKALTLGDVVEIKRSNKK